MSIIEKALGKQRSQVVTGKDPARDNPRASRSIGSVADHPSERTAPRASIEVSLDALRADGVLPPAAASERLHQQIRRIKRPLLEAMHAHAKDDSPSPANVLMITSSVAAEGKTFISLNVALSIARERDVSVLLVDADVAKRHITSLLEAEDRPGVTDAAVDEDINPEDLVLGTGIPGLLFLPAGRRTSVAPELFGSRRMAELVSALARRDRQRLVMFDSSPLLATNEAALLAKLVDQVLLVVRAESTQQAAVSEAIALLDKSKNIQCVLNQTHLSSLSEHYYYGYGYYSHERPKDV